MADSAEKIQYDRDTVESARRAGCLDHLAYMRMITRINERADGIPYEGPQTKGFGGAYHFSKPCPSYCGYCDVPLNQISYTHAGREDVD